MRAQRFSVLRSVAVLVAILVWGCARAPAVPEIPEVALGAQDFAYVIPDTITGGLVRIHFQNDGQEDHHAQFIRLNDGVTRAQFDSVFQTVMEAIPTEGEVAFMRLFDVATVLGGPGLVAPGVSTDVTLDLPAGEYVLMCFVPSPDGIPHLVKGMRRWLSVAAPAGEPPAAPVADGRVDMGDFAFLDMPQLDSGQVLLEVTNSGQEPHEMVVMRLDEGVEYEQVAAMLAGPPPSEGEAPPPGPPPFRFVGGMQAIMPGAHAWVTLDLTPGNYVLVCLIPSPANGGRPHVALGMIRPFTVG